MPRTHPIELRFHLVVGNRAEGVSGRPYVFDTSFVGCIPRTVETQDKIEVFNSLGALPAAFRRVEKLCRKKQP